MVSAVYTEDLVDAWGAGFAVNVRFRVLLLFALIEYSGSQQSWIERS